MPKKEGARRPKKVHRACGHAHLRQLRDQELRDPAARHARRSRFGIATRMLQLSVGEHGEEDAPPLVRLEQGRVLSRRLGVRRRLLVDLGGSDAAAGAAAHLLLPLLVVLVRAGNQGVGRVHHLHLLHPSLLLSLLLLLLLHRRRRRWRWRLAGQRRRLLPLPTSGHGGWRGHGGGHGLLLLLLLLRVLPFPVHPLPLPADDFGCPKSTFSGGEERLALLGRLQPAWPKLVALVRNSHRP